MNDIAQAAVEAALKAGADYADARIQRVSREEMVLKNGVLERADAPEEFGIGVRVLRDGAWGFAAAPAAPGEMRDVAPGVARRAAKCARDVAPARLTAVALAPEGAHVAEYATPVEEDPFRVPLQEKLDLLRAADRALAGRDEVVVRAASLSLRRAEQWLATSEGSAVHQVQLRSGAGIHASAATAGEVETRSYPNAFGGNYRAAGWEHVRGLDLPGHASRVRDEAIALCYAEPCPAGRRTLLVGGAQLMLQIHESVGHPNEIDRVFGHEVDLAGSSFATPEKLGTFVYASPIVSFVADSTVPGGLDTRGYDDEGVESGRWYVVRDGIFVGYHTGREWAERVGEARSRGAMRAESWYAPPIVRITNLSLLPGSWELEDLIADTEDGAILADTVKMWSIDERRQTFQFTCEIGWEIRGGKLGSLLRRPTYQGDTSEFWRSCDAICNERHWQLWGVPNCGKGNPMQVAEMSHGAAPARFRGVTFLQA